MMGDWAMRLFDAVDTNKDGKVTQDEVDAWRDARFAQFDADKDGQLSLDEYKALWMDMMQRPMVRAFQGHDADGNGLITQDEFRGRFAYIVVRFDANGDGVVTREEVMQQLGHGPHGPGSNGPGPRGPGGPEHDDPGDNG